MTAKPDTGPVVIGYRISSHDHYRWNSNGVRTSAGTSWVFQDRAQALRRLRRDLARGCGVTIERVVIPEAL